MDKIIPYEKWEIVYEDSEIDVRRDPQELDGYGLQIKNSEELLLFPRGTLKEVALTNRDYGKVIIKNLPLVKGRRDVFEKNSLTLDSIIAAIGKVHIKEETMFQELLKK